MAKGRMNKISRTAAHTIAEVEPTTTDRVQAMIDDEVTGHFPAGAVPRLTLLRHGDHPLIEPGELYLRVAVGRDTAAREAWIEEHFDRLEDFRVQRLPEVKGFVVTTAAEDAAGRRPTGVMKMDGISMLAPEEHELARGLTPVMARLGPAGLVTLDTVIIAGIAASRAEATRWALARVREQPDYARLSEGTREPGGHQPGAGLDQAARDRLQGRLDQQVKEHFPGEGVQRVAVLGYGDDPWVEPGDLLVRVFIEEAEEDPPLRAWTRDHETMIRALQDELTRGPAGHSYLEFWFGENGRQGRSRHRLGSPGDPARPERDLTPVDVRLEPADLEMLDTLITAGAAASRAEAISWALARIRERPAYARLSQRARELDELKANF